MGLVSELLWTSVDTSRLEQEFGGSKAELRVVSRQLRNLLDSGQLEADRGHELTIGESVDHLSDASADSTLIERWNWWMGALKIA